VLTPPDTEEIRKVGETQRKEGGFHVVGAMTLVGRKRTRSRSTFSPDY
jgi:hypothetical protein